MVNMASIHKGKAEEEWLSITPKAKVDWLIAEIIRTDKYGTYLDLARIIKRDPDVARYVITTVPITSGSGEQVFNTFRIAIHTFKSIGVEILRDYPKKAVAVQMFEADVEKRKSVADIILASDNLEALEVMMKRPTIARIKNGDGEPVIGTILTRYGKSWADRFANSPEIGGILLDGGKKTVKEAVANAYRQWKRT